MKKTVAAVVVLIVALSIAGCTTSKEPQPAEQNRTIRVGAIFSSTGMASDYGKKGIEGVQFAVELLNQRGGINGQKVEVTYEDAKSTARDAVSALKKLSDTDKISIMVGDVYSGTTKALIENLPAKTILFAPGASRPDLVNINPHFVRNWTSDNFDGQAMANIVLGDSVKEIATLTQVGDYTVSLNEVFKNEFTKKGGKITAQESFEAEKGDYKPLLQKLKAQNPKDIYLTALSKEMGTILKQAKEINFTPHWYTNLTVNTDDCKKIAGNAVEGVVFSRPYMDLGKMSPESASFISLYKTRKGSEPDETIAHAFDAMNILFLAIESVGTDTEAIVKYINSLKDYPGVSGKTTFDGHGGVVKDIEVVRMVNNSPKSIKVFSF